jgi:hypothetical protein
MRTPATRVRRLFVLMLVLAGSVNALLVQAFTNGAELSHAKSQCNSTPCRTRLVCAFLQLARVDPCPSYEAA